MDFGSGSANTDLIIAQNNGAASAAKLCRDYNGGGKTDWFLPSRFELSRLKSQKDIVGGFSVGAYWTSTEWGNTEARYISFTSSVTTTSSVRKKSDRISVRAIREF